MREGLRASMGSVPPWPPGKGLWSPSELSLRPTQLPHLRGCPWPPAQSLLSFALLRLCGQGWTPCRSHSAQWSSGFPTPSSLSPSVLEQQKRLPICPAFLGPTAGAGEHAPLAWEWGMSLSLWSPVFLSMSTDHSETGIVCLLAKSCLTLCNPLGCSPPGSSVDRIFQARILEWVAISCQPLAELSCREHGYFPIRREREIWGSWGKVLGFPGGSDI